MNGIKRAAQRLGRRLAAFVRELNYANRRSTELFLARAADLPIPGRPVKNYSEFLARTSGRLAHEPSAAARLAGQRVR